MIAATESVAYRDTLVLQEHKPGDVVRVLTAYRMGGLFVADGWEGIYVVISRLGTSPDYKLARVRRDAMGAMYIPDYHEAKTWDWDVIVHASRIECVIQGGN